MELKDILTLLFSFGALIFSFYNYKRGDRIDSENHLFNEKIVVYSKVLKELQTLINILQDSIEITKKFIKTPSEENKDHLDDHADKVDEACFLFNDFFISNSLVIPENILKLLSKFCEKTFAADTIDSQADKIDKLIPQIEKVIDELIADADKINTQMREDLHIDKLNTTLYRRLKKSFPSNLSHSR